MKLTKVLLGTLILYNWQFTNSVSSTPSLVVTEPNYSQNLLLAQITPDKTLGNENSIVVPDAEVQGIPAELIEGGAPRGINLFHSFTEFNVGEGQNVYFANPTGIDNILSRVTGSDVSNILGTLGVDGGADLFLINPNGIIFGKNSSLDVNGSFLATTADSIQFGEQGKFDASEPDTPPLLTVKPSALFFNQLQSGKIENRSFAPAGINIPSTSELFGLRVPDGESLILAGGNIAISGGGLNAIDGRIELVAVAEDANLDFNTDDNNLSLNLPSQLQTADISLSRAIVDTSGEGGGIIQIRGNNITIADESFVFADTFGTLSGRGISVEAKNLTIDGGSGVTTDVVGSGRGGGVTLQTEQLTIQNGAFLGTRTFGQGNAGSVKINADNSTTLESSAIFTDVLDTAVGNGGDIDISTGSLSLITGSVISASSLGQGNAGSIKINADNSTTLESSAIFTDVLATAVGNGGDIDISTDSLSVTGSGISASSLGQGNAGSIDISARDNAVIEDFSSVRSILGSTKEGSRGGNIDISAESVSVNDNAELNTSVVDGGKGSAGDITINASNKVTFDGGFAISRLEKGAEGRGGDLRINTGSLLATGISPEVADARVGQLVTATFGEGNAGYVAIEASGEVTFDGRGSDVFSLVALDRGMGEAGDIIINSNSLSVTNEARLVARTEAQGNAGDIIVNAESVSLANSGRMLADVFPTGIGDGGRIEIAAESLSVSSGGQIFAATDGIGNAGNIQITVADLVSFEGGNSSSIPTSGVFTNVGENATGNAGRIEIDTGRLFIEDGARINSDTSGRGNSGNIALLVRDLLLLRRNSNISTTANSQDTRGDGGNIEINADIVAAFPQENSDIRADAIEGRGGFIKIEAQGIFGLEERSNLTPLSDITAFSQQNPQLSGTVEIIVPETTQSLGLLQLPNSTAETQVVIACEPGGSQGQSEFVVTGRGGLPKSPESNLSDDFGLEDWRVGKIQASEGSGFSLEKNRSQNRQSQEIVEADRLIINDAGKVILVADNSANTFNESEQQLPNCQDDRS